MLISKIELRCIAICIWVYAFETHIESLNYELLIDCLLHIYAEMIGNVMANARSNGKYYHYN